MCYFENGGFGIVCAIAYLEIVDLGIKINRGIRGFAAALVAVPHAELPCDV